MNTLVKVARYHLVDPVTYLLLPWAITIFTLLVNLAIVALIPVPPSEQSYTGSLATLYIFLFVSGIMSVTKSLPFGFALGLSRRTYYLGTLSLIVGLSAVFALILTALNGLERLTNGWGLGMNFFRVPWLLDGPWYLTLLASFVLLIFFFIYGTWFGLAYRRWRVLGTVVFAAAQVLVLLAAAVIITWVRAWPAVGEFFGTLSAAGLIGVIAALAALLAIGGFGTVRRVTV